MEQNLNAQNAPFGGRGADKVIIFSAPSGSGKTTLVKHVLEVFPQLTFSVSCTTRSPRGTEVHGRDYYFLSVDEFRGKISEGAFIEFEEVYTDKFYGTLKSEVERIWGEGKTVIFDVDVQGGITLKKYFGEKALSVFIMPPSVEELENRLVSRATDDAETIKTRLAKAEEEIAFKDRFDEIIVNDNLQTAKEQTEKILTEFLQKP